MKLEISQSTSGQWILSASNDLKPETLERALVGAEMLEIFRVPSNEDEVERAVIQMKAATSRPVWMDAEDASAYEEALIAACQEYPIDVVELACKAWRQVPNLGKWWPTEQDLRIQCEAIAKPRNALRSEARRLLSALKHKRPDEPQRRSLQPYGRTREFVDRVREHPHLGQPFVRSYLSDMTCDFTEDTIYVAYSTQLERIPQRCAAILKDFPGLKVRLDKQTTQRCNRDQDAMGNTWKAPEPKKFKQKWRNG